MEHLDQQGHRKDYIPWESYFMSIACLSAKRSKDPSTQVGACIVDKNNRIISTGYNGFPNGCSDEEFPWARDGEDNKYLYVVHAELNAILNYRGCNMEGSTIYITAFPCNNCAKAIIQSGIKHIVYLNDKTEPYMHNEASYKMFKASNVSIEKFTGDLDEVGKHVQIVY